MMYPAVPGALQIGSAGGTLSVVEDRQTGLHEQGRSAIDRRYRDQATVDAK